MARLPSPKVWGLEESERTEPATPRARHGVGPSDRHLPVFIEVWHIIARRGCDFN